MSICPRDEKDRNDKTEKKDDWREPPGWLGDIVRRVKRQAQAIPRSHPCP